MNNILIESYPVFHVGKVAILRHSNYTVKFQRQILYQKIKKNRIKIKIKNLSTTPNVVLSGLEGLSSQFVGVGLRRRVKW